MGTPSVDSCLSVSINSPIAETGPAAESRRAESNLADAGGFAFLDAKAPPPGMSITLVSDDVPGTLASALEAGARLYVGITEKPWGQTIAYVLDPFGVLVEIATPVAAQ